MTRLLPGIFAMAGIVLASNILVQYPYGDFLTLGAFSYPFALLVGDLVNRLQGPQAARIVALAGFVVGVICSIIGTQIEGEFGPLVSLRVAVASATAFLCAQMLDISVFHALRQRAWWQAPLISSLLSSALDTAIFFPVAFWAGLSGFAPHVDVAWANELVPLMGHGAPVPFWISLAVGDFGVKVALTLLALIPFGLILRQLGQKLG